MEPIMKQVGVVEIAEKTLEKSGGEFKNLLKQMRDAFKADGADADTVKLTYKNDHGIQLLEGKKLGFWSRLRTTLSYRWGKLTHRLENWFKAQKEAAANATTADAAAKPAAGAVAEETAAAAGQGAAKVLTPADFNHQEWAKNVEAGLREVVGQHDVSQATQNIANVLSQHLTPEQSLEVLRRVDESMLEHPLVKDKSELVAPLREALDQCTKTKGALEAAVSKYSFEQMQKALLDYTPGLTQEALDAQCASVETAVRHLADENHLNAMTEAILTNNWEALPAELKPLEEHIRPIFEQEASPLPQAEIRDALQELQQMPSDDLKTMVLDNKVAALNPATVEGA